MSSKFEVQRLRFKTLTVLTVLTWLTVVGQDPRDASGADTYPPVAAGVVWIDGKANRIDSSGNDLVLYSGAVPAGKALASLATSTDLGDYYTKTNLQTSGQAAVHWGNLTNVPGLVLADGTVAMTAPLVTNGVVKGVDGQIVGYLVIDSAGGSGIFTDESNDGAPWECSTLTAQKIRGSAAGAVGIQIGETGQAQPVTVNYTLTVPNILGTTAFGSTSNTGVLQFWRSGDATYSGRIYSGSSGNLDVHGTGYLYMGGSGGSQLALWSGNIAATGVQVNTATLSAATGDERAFAINYTTNKATSGNDMGLKIVQTDTASPGTSWLIWSGVGTTEKFSVTNGGTVTLAGSLIVSTAQTPANASAAGTAGTVAWDADYIYVCTAANTWKRVAIATW